MRTLQPLPNAPAWMRCFDFVQVNEDEMSMMAPDPMGLAAIAFANGVKTLAITLGSRGVVYFAAPGFEAGGTDSAPVEGYEFQVAIQLQPRVQVVDPNGQQGVLCGGHAALGVEQLCGQGGGLGGGAGLGPGARRCS